MDAFTFWGIIFIAILFLSPFVFTLFIIEYNDRKSAKENLLKNV